MLDIGCGNAPLTIELAKRYPKARVTGIDYWGVTWEYSKTTCEKNAGIEGVASRTTFKKGSASALPFEDECFDAVVYGHAHVTASKNNGKTLIVSPGELCGYLTGKSTLALLDTVKREAKIIEL